MLVCRHPSDCADGSPCVQSQKAAVLDLYKIWIGTSEDKLIALSNDFRGVYRYALIMEEASESERNKASRSYDGMAQFSEQHRQLVAQLLAMLATLERGYQALLGGGTTEYEDAPHDLLFCVESHRHQW